MSHRMPALLVLVGMTACRSGLDKNEGSMLIEKDDGPPTWELVISMESSTTVAGEGVGYGLTLVSSAGDTLSVEGELSSDLEPDLQLNADQLIPTVAGTQVITADVLYDDEDYSATADLVVTPGPLSTLDLALSDLSMLAGDSISYTLSGWDAYGNTADTSGADIEVDSLDVSLGGGRITGTVPGTYTATASQDDVSDAETFTITSGLAASVELTLSDTDLELFETTHATVIVLDEYGNQTGDPWTLTAYGTGLTAVSYATSPSTKRANTTSALTSTAPSSLTRWARCSSTPPAPTW